MAAPGAKLCGSLSHFRRCTGTGTAIIGAANGQGIPDTGYWTIRREGRPRDMHCAWGRDTQIPRHPDTQRRRIGTRDFEKAVRPRRRRPRPSSRPASRSASPPRSSSPATTTTTTTRHCDLPAIERWERQARQPTFPSPPPPPPLLLLLLLLLLDCYHNHHRKQPPPPPDPTVPYRS